MLYPREQEIGGVAGDSDVTKIIFKIPSSYEGWTRYICFEDYSIPADNSKYTYPLADDDTFIIPDELTSKFIGKRVFYSLILTNPPTTITEYSERAVLYFSRTNPNNNVVSYLAAHSFIDADFVISETLNRPVLRFFRMDKDMKQGVPLEIPLELPFLADGKIPADFISAHITIYDITSPNQLTTLSDAVRGDLAYITEGTYKNNTYVLMGEYDVIDDWKLLFTNNPTFNRLVADEIVVHNDATLNRITAISMNDDSTIYTSFRSGATNGNIKLESGSNPDGDRYLIDIYANDTAAGHIYIGQTTKDDKSSYLVGRNGKFFYSEIPDINPDTDEVVKKGDLTTKLNTLPQYSFLESLVSSRDEDSFDITQTYISLDNQATEYKRMMSIPEADIPNNKAGLYTKALADSKSKVLVGLNETEGDTIATITVDEVQYPIKRGKVIFELGYETGTEPYHFSYRTIPSVSDSKITLTDFNITLDNTRTKTTSSYTLPQANVQMNQAGLYTKTLADAKQDKITDVEFIVECETWMDEGDFKVNVVSVPAIKSTHNPIISPSYSNTLVTAQMQREEASHIIKAITLDGAVKFYAEQTPLVDIPVIMKVM